MAHEPKKRHSRQRQGKRRNHIHLVETTGVICENCGQYHIPHTVCENCGFYRGQQYKKAAENKQR
jgi:large subunit ribosomal protein L32